MRQIQPARLRAGWDVALRLIRVACLTSSAAFPCRSADGRALPGRLVSHLQFPASLGDNCPLLLAKKSKRKSASYLRSPGHGVSAKASWPVAALFRSVGGISRKRHWHFALLRGWADPCMVPGISWSSLGAARFFSLLPIISRSVGLEGSLKII